MPRALYVTGRTFNLVRSRLPLMNKMKEQGWEVHAAALRQHELLDILESNLINFHHIPFARSSLSVNKDLHCANLLLRLIRKIKPDLIHYFNPKPIVLGGVVSRFLWHKPTQFITLTGMGMIKQKTFKNKIIQLAYKNMFSQADGIVFENTNDQEFCQRLKLATQGKGKVMISSGVDMKLYSGNSDFSKQPVRLLYASRLIWNKGFQELIDACGKLKKCYGNKAQVCVAGEFEIGHPSAVPEALVKLHHESGVINYLGAFKSDQMSKIIQDHDVMVLPSYSEGCSKFLMEGAAAAKPLIASDIPGCKEIVVHGHTGLLVKVKDSNALFEAMKSLVESESLRREYGLNARKKAVQEFDQQKLAQSMIGYYQATGLKLVETD